MIVHLTPFYEMAFPNRDGLHIFAHRKGAVADPSSVAIYCGGRAHHSRYGDGARTQSLMVLLLFAERPKSNKLSPPEGLRVFSLADLSTAREKNNFSSAPSASGLILSIVFNNSFQGRILLIK